MYLYITEILEARALGRTPATDGGKCSFLGLRACVVLPVASPSVFWIIFESFLGQWGRFEALLDVICGIFRGRRGFAKTCVLLT